jgi:hypothetical protein
MSTWTSTRMVLVAVLKGKGRATAALTRMGLLAYRLMGVVQHRGQEGWLSWSASTLSSWHKTDIIELYLHNKCMMFKLLISCNLRQLPTSLPPFTQYNLWTRRQARWRRPSRTTSTKVVTPIQPRITRIYLRDRSLIRCFPRPAATTLRTRSPCEYSFTKWSAAQPLNSLGLMSKRSSKRYTRRMRWYMKKMSLLANTHPVRAP